MEPSSVYYKKSSIKPLPPQKVGGGGGGLIYFKHIWGRRLIETGGLFKKGGYLF